MQTSRPVFRHSELKRVLAPQSVAIVGASNRDGAFGARAFDNLRDFTGEVFLVNAKYDEIKGKKCYPSLASLPTVPDCVLIATAKEQVEDVALQCAELGVGGIVIFASGYSETGKEEDIAAQRRLQQLASASGLKIVGPNCIGMANYLTNGIVSFAGVPRPKGPLTSHTIGLVSQSGALSFALGQAQEHGTSFSHIFASGNACDVDVADQVAFLAEEPSCKAIACVFEGIADPLRLLEAASIAAANNKAVVLYKMARSSLGASAAMSHTGSLAGSNEAYEAAFAKAGIISVGSLEALIETAVFFAKAPSPLASGVAVVATSGGASVIAADEAEANGVSLPQPASVTTDILLQHIPDFGSAKNPCDVTAQVANNPASLYACAEALFKDSAYGVVIVPIIYAYAFSTERIAIFNELAKKYGKMACVLWLTENLEGPGSIETEGAERVAIFRSANRCFSAIASWLRRDEWTAHLEALSDDGGRDEARAKRAAAMIKSATAKVLTEREAKQVLAEYGVPVVREILVNDEDTAVRAAGDLGFPIVMKVESPDIPHKTEAGVVRLNIANEDQVRQAYNQVMANARAQPGDPRINGVLVQPQVPPGVEILIGGKLDPLFGPLIVVGLGGILVELMKDASVALAPVSLAEAKNMLDSLKGKALLHGFRNLPAVDIDALSKVISDLSVFIAEQREEVAEFDVNPLICSGSRIFAVDALISQSTLG